MSRPRLNRLLSERDNMVKPVIVPVYHNPNRQHRSVSLDVAALERSGIRKILENVRKNLIFN